MLSSEAASEPGRAGNLLLAASLGAWLASAAGAGNLKRAEWAEKCHRQSRSVRVMQTTGCAADQNAAARDK